jgi:hypothetical protein
MGISQDFGEISAIVLFKFMYTFGLQIFSFFSASDLQVWSFNGITEFLGILFAALESFN